MRPAGGARTAARRQRGAHTQAIAPSSAPAPSAQTWRGENADRGGKPSRERCRTSSQSKRTDRCLNRREGYENPPTPLATSRDGIRRRGGIVISATPRNPKIDATLRGGWVISRWSSGHRRTAVSRQPRPSICRAGPPIAASSSCVRADPRPGCTRPARRPARSARAGAQ